MTDNSSTKVSETAGGEVVNGVRSCRDLSDAVPLYAARGIYLKPTAKIHVSINLPQLKTPGKRHMSAALVNVLLYNSTLFLFQ